MAGLLLARQSACTGCRVGVMRATVRAAKAMGGRDMADQAEGFEWTLLAIVLAALARQVFHLTTRLTWWMEVAPVLIALPLIMATHRRFPLTRLVLLH